MRKVDYCEASHSQGEYDFYHLWMKRYLTYFSESFSEIHISEGLKKAIDELYSHERTQIRMRPRNRLLSPLINKAHGAMPVPIRIRLYRACQKILDKKWNTDGREDYWYLDRSYISIKKRIDEEMRKQGLPLSPMWPETTPVCITHDIDTKYCMEKGIFDLIEIEEKHGIPSTVFLVPESNDYAIDERIFSFKQIEIGCHGLKHDGSFDLISPDERETRIKKSKKMLDRYSNIASFRAPWLLRTADMYAFLHSAGYTVSSSFMDIETQMWFGGCRWNYPTQPLIPVQEGWQISPIVELPITAPMDWSVFVGRKLAPEKVLGIFTRKYEFVKNIGGLSVFLFHPAKYDTGNSENLKIYDRFIERLASDEEINTKTLSSVAEELKSKKRYVGR